MPLSSLPIDIDLEEVSEDGSQMDTDSSDKVEEGGGGDGSDMDIDDEDEEMEEDFRDELRQSNERIATSTEQRTTVSQVPVQDGDSSVGSTTPEEVQSALEFAQNHAGMLDYSFNPLLSQMDAAARVRVRARTTGVDPILANRYPAGETAIRGKAGLFFVRFFDFALLITIIQKSEFSHFSSSSLKIFWAYFVFLLSKVYGKLG